MGQTAPLGLGRGDRIPSPHTLRLTPGLNGEPGNLGWGVPTSLPRFICWMCGPPPWCHRVYPQQGERTGITEGIV